MNLQEYVQKYGTGKLFALAHACEVSPQYLQNLLYTVNKNSTQIKTPSIKLGLKLSRMSGGELTMEGLASPVRLERVGDRPRMKKGFKERLDDGLGFEINFNAENYSDSASRENA